MSHSALRRLGVLPAELKNEVYRHALTATFPIDIGRVRRDDPKPDPAVKKWWVPNGRIATKSRKEPDRVAATEMLAISLLRASKAILDEALPILNAGYQYCFDSCQALEDFFAAIGENYELLTRVSVPTSGRQAQDQLQCVNFKRNPKAVEVRVDGWTKARSV